MSSQILLAIDQYPNIDVYETIRQFEFNNLILEILQVCDFVQRLLDIIVLMFIPFLAWICALIVVPSKCVPYHSQLFYIPVFPWYPISWCEQLPIVLTLPITLPKMLRSMIVSWTTHLQKLSTSHMLRCPLPYAKKYGRLNAVKTPSCLWVDNNACQKPNKRLRMKAPPCNIPINPISCPANLPPNAELACIDAPPPFPFPIIVHPPTSVPSIVGRSEFDWCFVLREVEDIPLQCFGL